MDIVALVKDLGFPAAIALYTLVVLNKTMKENTKALNALCAKMGAADVIQQEGADNVK